MPSIDRVRQAQRHEKLRDLMVAQVLKRVGRRVTDGEREFVEQEVDMLIHRGENSEASLNGIASHIRSLTPAPSQVSAAPTQERLRQHNKAAGSAVGAAAAAPRSQAPTSIVSAARAADAAVKRAAAQQQSHQSGAARSQAPENGPTPDLFGDYSHGRARLPRPAELHKDDLWATMAARDVEEYNRTLLEERRRAKKLEAEQRAYLEQQVALRERKVVETKKDEEKYVVEDARQREAWEVEIQRKEAERKKRFAEEKASRDAQLEAARKKRAAEEERRKAEDAIAAQRDKEAYEKEQLAIRQRRIQAKEEVVKAQQFNRQIEEIRAKEKAHEKARDLEHQRLFLERLQKQDEEREHALVKMHEKQRHQQQIAFQMQTTVAEKAADDERRAEEVKRQREAAEDAKARAIAEKAAAAKVKQRQYLLLQMIEKEEARKKDHEYVEVERTRNAAEMLAAERKEAERLAREKKKAEEHRRAIESQMALSEARHRPVYMSDAEKQLNKPILRKAGIAL